jgi:hypothetical protein
MPANYVPKFIFIAIIGIALPITLLVAKKTLRPFCSVSAPIDSPTRLPGVPIICRTVGMRQDNNNAIAARHAVLRPALPVTCPSP